MHVHAVPHYLKDTILLAMNPFPHQKEVARLVQKHDIGIFDLCCGAGKSYSMVLSSLYFKTSVVLAPTKNLVSQLYETFRALSESHMFIINSDNVVDKSSVVRAQKTSQRIVFVCNYQSIHVLKKLCDDLKLSIDVKFVDEAHNVTSAKRTRVICAQDSDSDSESSSDEATLEDVDMADIGALKSSKTFCFTATPTKVMLRRPEIYGPVLLKYTYAQAVIDKHVKNIDTVIECYASNDTTCLGAGYDRLIPAITKFIKEGDFKRVIVYTSRVNDSNDNTNATVNGLFKHCKMFPNDFSIHAVTSSTPPSVREHIFNTFRGTSDDIHVILSCMTISEGIDLPSCDAVVILDSTRSVVKIIQRALRACRLTKEERTVGTWRNAVVFYPINIPEKSLKELIQAGTTQSKEVITKHVHRHEFEFALSVIHFLKQNLGLEPLIECGSSTSRVSGNKKYKHPDPQTENKLSQHTTRVLFKLHDMVSWVPEKFESSMRFLTTNMVTSFDDVFNLRLEELKHFVQSHARLPSQKASTLSEKKLGVWCSTRRLDFKLNRLSDERIKMLEKVPYWSWNVIDDSFQDKLQNLRDFVSKNGRLPSKESKEKSEQRLGKWCSDMRYQYKKNNVSTERIQLLEAVKCWTWNLTETRVEKQITALQDFVKTNKRLPSRKSEQLDEKHLATWCYLKRQAYAKNQLSQTVIQAFEAVPLWYWTCNSKTKTNVLPETVVKSREASSVSQKRSLSVLSEYHKRFKAMNSSNLHKEFQNDPELFKDYHEVAEQNWKSFKVEDRPVYQAAQLIDKIHKQLEIPLRIVDFGAGTGKLKDLIASCHQLIGFDHVSVQDWIVAKDMRNTGLPDRSLDLCVFSMSLWGSNWEEYLIEASRILKPCGHVIIINKTRGWFVDEQNVPLPEKDTRIVKALSKAGLSVVKVLGVDTFFTTCVATKQIIV